MKSPHNKSPSPAKLVHLRALRMSGLSADPPRLHLDIFSPTMDEPTGPDQPHSKESPGPTTPSRSHGGSSPSPSPSRQRKASNSLSPAAASRTLPSLSPGASTIGDDSSPIDTNSSPQWSSAVGRATTGKSGRVIERLQAENDRLRRELKLESLRRDEEQKKGETARGMMEGLRITNGNLTQITEGDKSAISRKDRKIDELKKDLETERAKRTEAESQVKVIARDSETREVELGAAARASVEAEKRALTQYEVLSSSFKHLDEGYKSKVEGLRKDVLKLSKDGAEDRQNFKCLTVISEQQKKEIERLQTAKDAVDRGFDKYKDEVEESIGTMRERALTMEAQHDKVMAEATTLLNSMRHVIGVKETFRPDDP